MLSRSSVELSRRCTTLLTTVQREFDPHGGGDGRAMNGKKRMSEVDKDDENERPTKKKATTPIKNKQLDGVKGVQSSRSSSVGSAASAKSKGKAKKK